MATTIPKYSAASGELTPSMWGRVDKSQWHAALSVSRNGFISYRGSWISRAGTKFVGQCLQAASASSIPPRIIRFQFNIFQSYLLEFGDKYMRVIANGGYVTEAPVALTNITQANPAAVTVTNAFNIGDWVFIDGAEGMTNLNGRTFIVRSASGFQITLSDTFGNPINSLNFAAYTGGGTVARIYTIQAPYNAVDLSYLKVIQSADVMSLCCVNQQTGTEYAPVDLQRLASNNWNFQSLVFAASVDPPSAVTVTTSASGTTGYAYVVTSIDAVTGEESIASDPFFLANSIDIAATAGSHTITWVPVAGASAYNIYAAPSAVGATVPVGSTFGFIGFSHGNQFVNSNILPDFTTTPPIHLNPFARSTILSVTITNQGSGYTSEPTISVGGGADASMLAIVVNDMVTSVYVPNGGEGYTQGDAVTFTGGAGTGAAGFINVGPKTGTYPSVVNYFQARRVYAGTLNNPDTYFFSQTGAYLNFDSADPPIDSDAIIGTPWGEQVNGIQWLQPMPGGLIIATGLDTWQLTGTGGAGSNITPAQQSAVAQESNGFSATVQPLKVNYDILYFSSFSSRVYDLTYNFWTNIYSGTDISVLSNHLFDDFTVSQWAWAKQPEKLLWATRSDGKFLSLTFLKQEGEPSLIAWARHDTNGLVVDNAVATEPPVDAPYFIVKRFIPGPGQWAYYVERMDNRLWTAPQSTWCVDCGLALSQRGPNATLAAAAADGPGIITGGYIAIGGQDYHMPSAIIVDPTGQGSGGVISLTKTAHVITGFNIDSPGQNYSPGTYVEIVDSTGTGATFVPFISQNVAFIASEAVFTPANVGDVIRIGGGIATVTQYQSPNQVLATITTPIVNTIPDDPNNLPVPAGPGHWSITTPVSVITNLNHLEGMQVSILADGAVVAGGDQPVVTVVDGTVTLPSPASSVLVGLPFIAQYQTMHADVSGRVIQGKRKKVVAATIRMEASRAIQVGADQPVASTLPFQQEIAWSNLRDIPDWSTDARPGAELPLFTGDKFSPVGGDWQNWNGQEPSPGMVACQQTNPLPMSILAALPTLEIGDDDG